ncbi:hypothetical protein CHISP_1330 [Chitinispirillum alkaliphilum]|nr:hypothetical protein CHISP_1330 [Chitinispirillum alkaliphilum]
MDKGNKGLLTMIGEGAVCEGTLIVPHSIRIEGKFKGHLESSEIITVGSTGEVEADIKAKSAIIGGKVVGNMTILERVELEVNATMIGDLHTKDLVINDGAVFHGNCSMEKAEKGKAEKGKPA